MKRFLKSTTDTIIDGVTRLADYVAADGETRKTRKGLAEPLQLALILASAIASPITAYHLTDAVVESPLGADNTPLKADPKRDAFKQAAQKVATMNYHYNFINIDENSTLADRQNVQGHREAVAKASLTFSEQIMSDYRLSDRDAVILQQKINPAIVNEFGVLQYSFSRTDVGDHGAKTHTDHWTPTNYALKKDREACLVTQFEKASTNFKPGYDAALCIYKANRDLDSAEVIFPAGTILGGFGLLLLTAGVIETGANTYRRRLKAKQTLN
jgi:hypothetical protein